MFETITLVRSIQSGSNRLFLGGMAVFSSAAGLARPNRLASRISLRGWIRETFLNNTFHNHCAQLVLQQHEFDYITEMMKTLWLQGNMPWSIQDKAENLRIEIVVKI